MNLGSCFKRSRMWQLLRMHSKKWSRNRKARPTGNYDQPQTTLLIVIGWLCYVRKNDIVGNKSKMSTSFSFHSLYILTRKKTVMVLTNNDELMPKQARHAMLISPAKTLNSK